MKVMKAVRAAAEKAGLQPRKATALLIPRLKIQGLLSEETASTLGSLLKLRNEAADLPEFGLEPGQALEYARLAKKVIAALGEGLSPAASQEKPV